MNLPISGLQLLNIAANSSVKLQQSLLNLQVGQIIKAMVVDNPGQGRVNIHLQGQTISARSEQSFKPGQVLDVKVVETGKTITLKVEQHDHKATQIEHQLRQVLPKQQPINRLSANSVQINQQPELPLPNAVKQQVEQLVKQFVKPEQLTKPQTLKQVIKQSGLDHEHQISQSQTQAKPQPTVKGQIMQLLKVIQQVKPDVVTAKQLTPSTPSTNTSLPKTTLTQTPSTPIKITVTPLTIKTAITSPLTTPANLSSAPKSLLPNTPQPHNNATERQVYPEAKTNPSTAYETKTLGLPVKQAFPQPQAKAPIQVMTQNNPALLLQDIETQAQASLARIQANQIASLPTDQQPTAQIRLDIPVVHQEHVDNLQLLIKQEHHGHTASGQDDSHEWTIAFAMNLPSLGPLQTELKIKHQQLQCHLWFANPDTVQLVENALPELIHDLNGEGFEVSNIHCYQGLKTDDGQLDTLNLLDTKV